MLSSPKKKKKRIHMVFKVFKNNYYSMEFLKNLKEK